jgi:hypothetical protein
MACIGTQKRRANDDPYGVGEQSGKRVKSLRALERALLPEPFRYCSTPGPRWAHCHSCPLAPTCPKHGAACACTSMYLLILLPPLASYPLPVLLTPGAPYVIYTVLFGLVRKSFHCLHPCGSRPTYGVHLIYHLHAKHWNGHNPRTQLWERGLGCDTSELSDACGPSW